MQGISVSVRREAVNPLIASLHQGDNRSTRITFVIPRRQGDVDLGTLKWRLEIVNASGFQTFYTPTERTVDDDTVSFYWLPEAKSTTAEVGIVHVQLYCYDTYKNKPVWQSALYHLEVRERTEGEIPPEEAVALSELQQLIVYVGGELPGVVAAGQLAKEAYQHPPVIGENGNWWVWDWQTGAYADTGKPSQGEGGGGGNVASVNGKIGAVVLTAEDVGAQPKGDYLTTEEDPTVPAWAKQPEKPTYSAAEVGAQPKGDYALKSEIPTVPAPYTLPTASDTVKGGVMIGNGLVMDGDVLGVDDDKYELLQTIDVVEEVAEIVVTDLRLKEILVTQFTPESGVGARNTYLAASTMPRDLKIVVGSTYIHNTNKFGARFRVYKSKGFWDGMSTGNTRGYGGGNILGLNNTDLMHTAPDEGYIHKARMYVSGGVYPVGSKIEIWGVRA